MKLYSKSQMIAAFEKYGNMSAINARNIIDLSESIELPTDEEIRDKSIGHSDYHSNQSSFVYGAKWVIEQIKNQWK